MSSIGGANIVTNGLVLALDAANRNSYVSGSTIWRDISGTIISDNIITGGLVNGPTYNNNNGGSINFDGVNDSVITNYYYSLTASSNFSVNLWFKSSGHPSINYVIISNYSVPPPAPWVIYVTGANNVSGSGVVGATSRDNSGNIRYLFGYTPVNDNKWNTCCYTKSGSLFSLYVNGILEVTQSYSLGTVTSTEPIEIGGLLNNDQYFMGSISNVCIYNKSLSASEVLQNYNALER